MTSSTFTGTLVVVVDDRSIGEAAALRADIGAAVRHVGATFLAEFGPPSDLASWHPVDIRIILVPASSPSIESVASPATNPALAWTTNQATQEGRNALALAVDAEVGRMTAMPGAAYRPLERARDVVHLLDGTREASGEVEKSLVASLSSRRRKKHYIGVSIVTASDDESPEPSRSYLVDLGREAMAVNVVTGDGRGLEAPDPDRFPRLNEWAKAATDSVLGTCVDYRVPCDARPIEEISPGVGRCYVEITTTDPPVCDRSRGWVDPLGADGVRRPRLNDKGETVCEVLPVDAAVMDACIHDATCANCGSGWCVSEVRPTAGYCRNPLPKMLRWVGGVLPEPGSLRATCSEPP
jgi:hypothetical protein